MKMVLEPFPCQFLKTLLQATGLNVANICMRYSKSQHASSGITKNGIQTLPETRKPFK
jgi:hypothetical protein